MGLRFRVLGLMHSAKQHEFFLLTKRADELSRTIDGYRERYLVSFRDAWPREYPHVWIGVSVTNQEEANERIPLLLNVPAKNRWLSLEPLLAVVDLAYSSFNGADSFGSLEGINWVVVGSIDYPTKAFPAPRREWIDSIVTQCRAAGVPVWVKNNAQELHPETKKRQRAMGGGFTEYRPAWPQELPA